MNLSSPQATQLLDFFWRTQRLKKFVDPEEFLEHELYVSRNGQDPDDINLLDCWAADPQAVWAICGNVIASIRWGEKPSRWTEEPLRFRGGFNADL